MYEIKKINAVSLALICGWITALLSIIYLIFILLVSGGFWFYGTSPTELVRFLPFAVIAGYIAGFIVGALVALLYNLWAQWVSGIKIDIHQIMEAPEQTTANKKGRTKN
ncbi:hypothetical protein KKG41_05260 [Patescibacteria group bacterium]|nr:hypothetical protein [Patescibacteria group bacterium]MBU1890944.1 hypothetical protein [Patescibacteria group bacterium]